MFKAGDKVVCVDGSPGRVTGKRELKKGDVYCVRECQAFPNGVGVRLSGITLPDVCGTEPWFHANRFRLVSEVKMILALYKTEAIGKEVECNPAR